METSSLPTELANTAGLHNARVSKVSELDRSSPAGAIPMSRECLNVNAAEASRSPILLRDVAACSLART
jgi:hypothetical protein